jgi:hypothetical protein
MKQIERQVIRKRLTLIRKGRAVFASAIRDQYQAVVNAVSIYSPNQLKEMLPQLVSEKPIQQAFEKMYVQAMPIAEMWRKYLLPPKKDGVDDMYLKGIELKMREFARSRTGTRIKGITETTRERVSNAINYAMETGGSVDSMTNIITSTLMNDYKEFTQARARMISQTEMITASNEASIQAGFSTGLETRKFWSTSGLGNVRDSHLQAEADSNDAGGYADDEPFSNGLMYPGDPTGPPEEVINCHCCVLLEIV